MTRDSVPAKPEGGSIKHYSVEWRRELERLQYERDSWARVACRHLLAGDSDLAKDRATEVERLERVIDAFLASEPTDPERT